jgi:hypothetical protein
VSQTSINRKKNRLTSWLAAAAIAGSMVGGIYTAVPAHANSGCQTVLWGFLGSQRRTICDGPLRGDGSWMRERAIWTPAHTIPTTTSCSGSSYVTCTSYGGGYVDTVITDDESYPVTDSTVLPDEPGHLA